MSGEPKDIPLPVTFVRAMATPSGVRIHDWRSRTSGRIFEVPEVHVYATGDDLRQGDPGFLRFSKGQLYVVRTEHEPAPRRPHPLAPTVRQAATVGSRARSGAGGTWRPTMGTLSGRGRARGPRTLDRGFRAFARAFAHTFAHLRRLRLPRLSGRAWFSLMLGTLVLVVLLRYVLG